MEYNTYKLNKYDICVVGPELLKKVEESIWDSIFNSYNFMSQYFILNRL